MGNFIIAKLFMIKKITAFYGYWKQGKSAFLSGIALFIISILLLFLGPIGLFSKNYKIDTTFFFAPLFFLVTGIVVIAVSREKNLKAYKKISI